MNITRYIQSCLLIEEDGTRILIDPSGQEKESSDKFGQLNAVLYTHEHADHFDPGLAKQFLDKNIPVYANASTAKQIDGNPNVVEDGIEFSVGSIKIKAIELPHCLMPDGSEGPQNTGYLINNRFLDPGDSTELEGLQVENLALPITGPDISMKDAFLFAKQLDAQNVIPVHYDVIGANPDVYAAFAGRIGFGFKFYILSPGESAEL